VALTTVMVFPPPKLKTTPPPDCDATAMTSAKLSNAAPSLVRALEAAQPALLDLPSLEEAP
jgi:hypothetical protein